MTFCTGKSSDKINAKNIIALLNTRSDRMDTVKVKLPEQTMIDLLAYCSKHDITPDEAIVEALKFMLDE